MSEILATGGVVTLAGGICFAMQLAAWKAVFLFTGAVERIRRFLLVAAVVWTVFVIGTCALIQLANGKFDPVELLILGAVCVGFFTISYLALAVTIRRREKSGC